MEEDPKTGYLVPSDAITPPDAVPQLIPREALEPKDPTSFARAEPYLGERFVLDGTPYDG
ncbi:MAG: hypothetical protein ABI828_02855 [Actinomycetota bacterium]